MSKTAKEEKDSIKKGNSEKKSAPQVAERLMIIVGREMNVVVYLFI